MLDFKLILKGMLIGLAKIIPGVSGSLLAVSLGIYHIGIEAVSHPFRNVKYNLWFLGNVGIGILFSIVLCSNIVAFFLAKYSFFTIILFIGFIVGTFPQLMRETHIHTRYDILIIVTIALFLFIVSSFRSTSDFVYQNSVSHNILVILFGFIDAATMVIPGISGTAIFLLLGCYPFILGLFASLTSFHSIISMIFPLLLFVSGLVLGVVIVSKLMGYALRFYKKQTYLCIFGFAFSSILLLCIDLFSFEFRVSSISLGIILFIFGYKVSSHLNT